MGSQLQTPPKRSLRSSQSNHITKQQTKARYFLAWRWHFYAGLFVIPFMIMLSITGLIMLFDDEIEQLRYSEIINVIPEGNALAPSKQLDSVKVKYPNAKITQFIASDSLDQANRFNVSLGDGQSVLVTVNPYTGEVIGEIDRNNSWYQLANDIHGTLLIGKWGDYLIEIAASLAILLLVSGIYLWLPKDQASRAGFLKLRVNKGVRVFMRDLHANLGGALSFVLLMFLLSGLAWTGVWGAKLVQGWNTFPTYYTWGDKPESVLVHQDLNHGSEEELPWNLEQSPVPQSNGHHGSHHAHHSTASSDLTNSIGLDHIIAQARQLGFTKFKVFLPQSKTGVYTVAANSMAGDVTDPRQDRTTHFDQYSGDILVDVTWEDYTLVAKLMAAGVSLHQGDLSLINKMLNALFCVALVIISMTGVAMWWVRRPVNQGKLGVPPRFVEEGVWKVGLASVIATSILFPLAGLTIIAMFCLDALIVRKNARLAQYFS
ncbi:PepSY-associated TM helix domain-containing protein [Vibrio galatheae]